MRSPDRQGYYDVPLAKFTTKSKIYEVASTIIFPGSDFVGVPKQLKIVAGRDSGSINLDVRVYDALNATMICEVLDVDASYPSIIDLGSLSNVSLEEAVWEVQIRRQNGSGSKNVSCSSMQARF